MFSEKGVFGVFPPNIDKKQVKPCTLGEKMKNNKYDELLHAKGLAEGHTHTHINTSSHKFSWLNNSS